MKEIVAIIRSNKVNVTKAALDSIGYPGMTGFAVLGRGKQRGIAGECGFSIASEVLAKAQTAGMKFIPKRLLIVVVADEDVDRVVSAIVSVNQTNQIGDGRIFVCPVEEAVRVRTGETGDKAIL
ncbi:MAG TPA: P-II family nitrogen regulator [Methylomusa anaerophila]|uniref:Nitrogen regulatory protein P-II n=1 Tax=Methylomusa anaerophila TaxID=1930071 RepID=A0A348AFG8_9FIRM|nr:P-II family nitrogen regulator [Methylomusa anaerophila]BBB89816.1 nitrogen regulatory protein P-II [Methylomusa anaerophila]HML89138.1 P-II family nitrogen regulator [Methylomusa anaerophila]